MPPAGITFAGWCALAFLAGAAALLIGGILLSGLRPLRVVLTGALVVASVACARVALRHAGTAQRTSAPAAPSAKRPGHPAPIINPRSGGGKAAKFHLENECRARGIEPIVLKQGDDLGELAEGAISRGADVIGMAGGDGSQALVATIAARHRIPHVVIPAGTRNHFALDLGLDRDDVVGALDAFADGAERRVDLADVNGRVFVYRLDHIGGVGTRARMDLGTLGVVAARIAGPSQAQRFVALESVGRIRRFEGWLEWEAKQFQVGSGGPVEIGIDGEALTMDPPLVFSSRPGALRVLLPRHAAARSPAARPPSIWRPGRCWLSSLGSRRGAASADYCGPGAVHAGTRSQHRQQSMEIT